MDQVFDRLLEEIFIGVARFNVGRHLHPAGDALDPTVIVGGCR
jgi:hypothetical protein